MKVYKTLMVGCGGIAHEWLPVLRDREDCKLIGVVDLHPEAARQKLEQYGIECPVYADFDPAIGAEKPDVVVDLTFPDCHHDITITALRAGCDVFGEKPMSMNREDALHMLDVAKESGRTYNVMQNRRFLAGIRGMREAVRSGLLGDIWNTCCEIYVNADLSGFRNTLPYPMLQDQAIHSFDSARFILGTDAKTVYAHTCRTPGTVYNGCNAGACIYEMADGSVLTFNAVMDTNFYKTTWHSQWRVIGNRGTAMWNGFDEKATAAVFREDGSIEKIILEAEEGWKGITCHAGVIDEMFCDLAAGRESQSSAFYNYGSMAMEFSALESIQKDDKVQVR
ncbi:MAG: Gfo/Idh/MocA family oxidoreductase [Oscillospiraceae bacterium]|nr:Gfo/Idh/MocA family oxidoreductase [Oscillospiraceae bacterium]